MSGKFSYNRRKKIFSTSILFLLTGLLILFIFNRNGLLAILSLNREKQETLLEIEYYREGIDRLRSEIERLQSDSFYIEKRIREILGWGRMGEMIIRIVPEEDVCDPLNMETD